MPQDPSQVFVNTSADPGIVVPSTPGIDGEIRYPTDNISNGNTIVNIIQYNLNTAGANNQVLINKGNIATGDPELTYDAITNILTAETFHVGNITTTNTANLGNVGNVKIAGGSNGYILKTDGSGNLSWTSQQVATSTWSSLTGKPIFATVATSGSYNDLSNIPSNLTNTGYVTNAIANITYASLSGKPNLATVATTGNFSDLLNPPSLMQVATTGDYNDLSNKPSIPSIAGLASNAVVDNKIANAIANVTYANLSDKPNLATVATSGKSEDLIWTFYPTEIDLPNASSKHGMFAHVHVTEHGYMAHSGNWIKLANFDDIPNLSSYATQSYVTSQGYITSADLSGYATTSDLSGYQLAGSYLTSADLSGYATTSDLSGYQLAGSYLTSADLSGYATTSNLSALSNTVANITYANLSGAPNIANYATNSNVSNVSNTVANITWANLSGKPALFSGNYNDLTSKPTLFSGNYVDLTNKPALFSGNYNDLTSKPALFSGNYVDLTNKPALFSGNYNDLTSKPTLFSGAYSNLTGTPTLGNISSINTDGNASNVLYGNGVFAASSVTPSTTLDNASAGDMDVMTYDGNLKYTSNVTIDVSTGTLKAKLFSGNGSSLTSLAGANITGTVANATIASSANSVAWANVSGKPTIATFNQDLNTSNNVIFNSVTTDDLQASTGANLTIAGGQGTPIPKSIVLNGTSGYMTIPSSPDWIMGKTWTFEFRIKMNATSVGTGVPWRLITQEQDNAVECYMGITISGGELSILCTQSNALYFTEPTPGQWVHVAVVNNNVGPVVYYNGVAQTYTQGYGGPANYTSSNAITIGRFPNNNYQYFPGEITGIRISDVVRYTQNFTPTTETFDIDSNLLLLMNVLDGQEYTDSSSYNRTISNYNTTLGTVPGIGLDPANVVITANALNWTFDTSGDLTLPTNTSKINYANGTSILSGISSTYANSNVANYLPTYTGNINANIITANIHASPINSNLTLKTHAIYNITTITNGGTGYGSQSGVSTSGGSGTGMTVNVNQSGTIVDLVIVNNPGTGYVNGDTITILGGSGTATFTIANYSSTDTDVTNNWIFGTNGNLTLPGGGSVYNIGTGTAGITANITSGNAYLGLDDTSSGATLFGNAGVQIGTNVSVAWNFTASGNLTLPTNTAKINYANGVSILDGISGGASTGNITFDGDNIGSSNDVVNIVGNNYAQLESHGSYIWVEENAASVQVNSYEWIFHDDAILELANGANISQTTDGGGQKTFNITPSETSDFEVVTVDGNIRLQTANSDGGPTVTSTWTFDKGGNLSLPHGGVINEVPDTVTLSGTQTDGSMNAIYTRDKSNNNYYVLGGSNWSIIYASGTYGLTYIPQSLAYMQSTDLVTWTLGPTTSLDIQTPSTGVIGVGSTKITSKDKTWSFGTNGTTVFPTLTIPRGDSVSSTITGQTLLFGDNTQEAIISTPNGSGSYNDSQRLVINPGKGYEGGEGGDIYLWAGRGGNASGTGGDIKIRGGQGGANTLGGSGGNGGYIRIEAGDGANQGDPGFIVMTAGEGGIGKSGGYVNITGGLGNTAGGDVQITGGRGRSSVGGSVNIWGGSSDQGPLSEGNVNIETGGNTWAFDATGNLTLPTGGVITETSIPTGGLDGNTISLKPSGGTNADQQLFIYPTGAGSDFNHLHLTSGNLWNTELFLGNDNFYVKLANTGNIIINSNDNNGNVSQWRFNTDGSIYTIDELTLNVSDGIPTSLTNLTHNQGWGIGSVGSNLPTTGGSGTGLTVDVADGGSAYSSIVIHTAGTGYTDGDIITVSNGGMTDTFTISVPGTKPWVFDMNGNLTLPNSATIIAPSSNDLTVRVTGQYNICTILTGGSGYGGGGSSSAVSGGSGTGMIVGYGYGLSGQVSNLGVTTPGTGYQDGDVLTMTAGNGDATFVITKYNTAANAGNNNTAPSDWIFDITNNITLPLGGDIKDSTGATKYIGVSTLKTLVATSTDFTDFQARIAAL